MSEENYYTTVRRIVKENNRQLENTNAQSSYVTLLKEGVDEELSYQVNKLLEHLHFSACEMWLNYNGPRILKDITLRDVEEIYGILPKNYKDLSYSSENTTKMLCAVYNFSKERANDFNLPKWSFYNHLYTSCSKELFCYRGYKS